MRTENITQENKQWYFHGYYTIQAVNSFKYRKHKIARKGFSIGLSLFKNLTGYSKRFYYQNYFGKFSSQKQRYSRILNEILTGIEESKKNYRKNLFRRKERNYLKKI